ncbi:MAG: hypothetical protein H6Q30_2490 [Bacteroidetes bacterium]|nr:hypothetical protein [Bacteroidota bacterium]
MEVKGLLRRAGAIAEIPGVVLQAKRMYHGTTLGILVKLYKSITRRYLPEEAFYRGLLNPTVPDSEFDRNCSRSDMAKLQRSRNPLAWEYLLADKSIFYRYCELAGIPVPSLYALWSKHTPGWTCNGRLLTRRDQWVTFLERDCPPDIVIKPNRGVYGNGIQFFQRHDGRLLDPAGRAFSAGEVLDSLVSDREFDVFVIQARLRNHPLMERLHGTDALHTLRIVTVLQADGGCVIPYVKYKVIGGDAYVDNFRHGHLGNISMEIDIDTGTLREPYSQRVEPPRVHPKSGRALAGFQIPFWEETLATVKDCARKFSPIGTVGWDVAVTPTGPVIIEGNIWYDPPSPSDVRPVISAIHLADAC